jgi:hypothetical protein|tara:strand:- start:64 stop:282 length:219 start_codon:yes stop_codon:yes gene_type:complete
MNKVQQHDGEDIYHACLLYMKGKSFIHLIFYDISIGILYQVFLQDNQNVYEYDTQVILFLFLPFFPVILEAS